MPAISIVLMDGDSSAHRDACLTALLAQTFSDFEILCIYSDVPLELQQLASEDGRLKLFAADASDLSFAWRGVLKQSEARYAYFMDDATVLDPRMLGELYELAERLDLDVALCNGAQTDDSSAITGTFAPNQAIRRDLLPLHEAFSADEVTRQLLDAVPQRSWDRLYRREFLLDSALADNLTAPATSRALALTAIVAARRIDYVDGILATHADAPRVPANELDELLKAKRHLEDRGIYQRFERDFVNYASGLLLGLWSALPADEQDTQCANLKDRCADLGITGKARWYFYQGSTYDELVAQLSWADPSVTVLMPSLNVAPFIRQAVESVLNQTLKSIEVLCIDAGSTDGTLEILREYEVVDPRVHVIVSDKRSYGHQMNLGLAAARGEFIGIVETDDFVDPEMFETLYRKAKLHKAQLVKGNFYDYQTRPVEKSIFHNSYYQMPYNCPLTDEEKIEANRRVPSIWAGIYETKMLRDNGIDFLETPGASYQDTSFVLKVWLTVARAVLDEHAFLHYRRDNEASSVRQSDKVYYVNGEFASAYEYCRERHGSDSGFTKSLRYRQAMAYLWNYNRIADEFKLEYLERFRDEFLVVQDAGELDQKYFKPTEWDQVQKIMESPSDYYASRRSVMPEGGADDGPVLTIIVNACGCDERMARCLESIACQDLSHAEVILVDDLRDETVSAQLEAQSAGGEHTTLVSGEDVPLCRQLNKALAQARGTWVLFIDGNSALEIDAVKRLVNYLCNSSSDVVLLKHDEYDAGRGELLARGKGIELGQRRGLNPINAQTDARSILQIADAHVANKVFRRSYVEQEQLTFSDDALNGDVVFCELGLLRADSIGLNMAILVDTLVGEDAPRDAMLKRCPEAATDAWRELLEEAERQGLLLAHSRTIVNAAAKQLADDMETLRGCHSARAKLCAAVAGDKAFASGVAGQDRPFYASEWVRDHVHGAVQAVAFASGNEVEPSLQQAASTIATVRDALFGVGAEADDVKPFAELVARAVDAAREAGGAAEFLWWCLPVHEQQVLDELIGAKLHGLEALDGAAAREASLRAEIGKTKHQLLLRQRELVVARKQLATSREQAAALKRRVAETEKQVASAKKDLKAAKKKAVQDVRAAKESVKASRSYRLGNALGAPLRAARSVRDKLLGE